MKETNIGEIINGKGKLKCPEKSLVQSHFIYHKFSWIVLGLNPGLGGDNMATMQLSYGGQVNHFLSGA
jgi:hypothetical protein